MSQCINCGAPVKSLTGAEDTTAENKFCPQCAAQFIENVTAKTENSAPPHHPPEDPANPIVAFNPHNGKAIYQQDNPHSSEEKN